ncbi:hypothetical protein MLD38_020568 [Melastoma candidum]|uniref:Uncharacterized protein n=1 Tax=Melastoma candidum TaxID=119954 RepID=A0ACB9QDF3_9MYRT|nr:hypothetical protein MLD38_020568 [Melastoma candidum]
MLQIIVNAYHWVLKLPYRRRCGRWNVRKQGTRVADHANNLASKIRGNLTNSTKALGVDILTGPQKVKCGKDNIITAKNIIIATGYVPFVPKGNEVDGKLDSNCWKWLHALEFSDIYTALCSEVTFVEALAQLMPGFDPQISKLAQRVLINPRNIDYHTGVIELIDAKAKEARDTLEDSS